MIFYIQLNLFIDFFLQYYTFLNELMVENKRFEILSINIFLFTICQNARNGRDRVYDIVRKII